MPYKNILIVLGNNEQMNEAALAISNLRMVEEITTPLLGNGT